MSIALTLGLSLVVSPANGDTAPEAAPSTDLANAAGSVRFPAGNTLRSDLPAQQLALQQSWTNATNKSIFWRDDPEGLSAIFMKVRLPKELREVNAKFALLTGFSDGSDDVYLRFEGNNGGTVGIRNRVSAKFGSSGTGGTLSAEITEEEFLIVATINAAGYPRVDWYEMDGTAHPGTPDNNRTTPTTFGATFDHLTIGASAGPGDVPSPGSGGVPSGGLIGWPGEIAQIGFVFSGTQGQEIPSQVWADIATSVDLETALSGLTVQYVRDFDGTAATLDAPAWATDDAGATTAVWPAAGNLAPGSHIGRNAAADWITADKLPTGFVYGVVPGATSRDVTLSGTADTSRDGEPVRARIVYENGDIALGWTDVGTIASGAWSGSVTVPFALDAGWFGAVQYAVGSGSETIVYEDRTLWGVGHVFMWLGQSQLGIALGSSFAGFNTPAGVFASYATTDGDNGAPQIIPMAGREPSDALAAFAAQYAEFAPSTPVMVLDAAINGTGMEDLITDGQGRNWSVLQEKLDLWGNTMTGVLHQWGTNDMGKSNLDDILQALYDGTGPEAADHDLTTALAPGFALGVSPLTRHTGTATYVGNASQSRTDAVIWANANGHPVGPPVSDFRIEDAGGPHQSGSGTGNPRLGARMAFLAAQCAGLSAPENPHFTGTVTRSGDTLTIPVTLPNGGSLSSPAPTALRSFEVDEGGGYTASGFSAAVSGSDVVLTRDSGTWAPGTSVRYLSNLETRTGGDGAAEDAILAGALYETYEDSVNNVGLPVGGTLSDGKWVPDFEAIAL